MRGVEALEKGDRRSSWCALWEDCRIGVTEFGSLTRTNKGLRCICLSHPWRLSPALPLILLTKGLNINSENGNCVSTLPTVSDERMGHR